MIFVSEWDNEVPFLVGLTDQSRTRLEIVPCSSHEFLITRSVQRVEGCARQSDRSSPGDCGGEGKTGGGRRRLEKLNASSGGKCFAAATPFPRDGRDKQEMLLRSSVVPDFARRILLPVSSSFTSFSSSTSYSQTPLRRNRIVSPGSCIFFSFGSL